MNQYTFDRDGVNNWQTDLYASNEAVQDAEKEMIKNKFDSWLAERFGLTPVQLAYLQKLNPQFVAEIQQSLVSYIDYHLPITLDKEDKNTKNDSEDSVKVTELRKWWEGRDEAPSNSTKQSQVPEQDFKPEGELTIRIYYMET